MHLFKYSMEGKADNYLKFIDIFNFKFFERQKRDTIIALLFFNFTTKMWIISILILEIKLISFKLCLNKVKAKQLKNFLEKHFTNIKI